MVVYQSGRKVGNVLFNDALTKFYLRLYGVRHIVKDHSDSERGNRLPPHGLLFPINSKGSFICIIPDRIAHITAFVTPVVVSLSLSLSLSLSFSVCVWGDFLFWEGFVWGFSCCFVILCMWWVCWGFFVCFLWGGSLCVCVCVCVCVWPPGVRSV